MLRSKYAWQAPIEEFQVDYSEDDEADGVMNKNVEFDMESGGTEIVDDEILDQAQSEVIIAKCFDRVRVAPDP